MDISQRYLACVFGTCGTACAFCTRIQPGSGIGVSLRSVEYSPFLVGVEWRRLLTFSSLAATMRRRSTARRYRIGVTTCWSWVHWCKADSALPRGCSSLHLPRNVSSVVLMGLVPFIRYKYSLRSFRGDPNSTDVLFSMPTTATRRDRLSFELFLYTEMLVVFLLAGALTLVALLTIGFILMRALGLTAFLDVEPDELAANPGGVRESQAQGDHRRHVPGVARRRRGAAALPRVRSRGDS
ncbi:hypothetical protein HPB51_014833 [Rhipicephalus microplus]|uniref:Uncharacterized protein n=1 Tax=Rhipicephalus microplus TaxID=6941 RepID=A0A9J6DNW6_RHIMP|nr:hypothetical protein HPB51_014833 [Rhipicephalus microplus]